MLIVLHTYIYIPPLLFSRDEDWDIPEERPQISSDGAAKIWDRLTRLSVFIISLCLFFIVLISTGLTRVIIHLMIWKLNPPNPSSAVYLNKFGGLLELVEERYFITNCSSECDSGYVRRNDLPSSWKCFTTTNSTSCKLLQETPTVNVWWIWGLIIIILVPDLYSLILGCWRICFKETDEFSVGMLLIVSFYWFIKYPFSKSWTKGKSPKHFVDVNLF